MRATEHCRLEHSYRCPFGILTGASLRANFGATALALRRCCVPFARPLRHPAITA